MTRRTFIGRFFGAAAIGLGVVWTFGKKALPRKFIWARKAKKYPGRLKPLKNITRNTKWSG